MLFVFGIFVVFLYANLMVYTLKKKVLQGFFVVVMVLAPLSPVSSVVLWGG